MSAPGSTHFLQVLLCVRDQHRPEMVLLAVLACALASGKAMSLLNQAVAASGRARRAHRRTLCLLGGLMLGFGGWSAHFITILGYDSGFVAGYSLVLTAVSLLVGIGGAQVALWFAVQSRTLAGRASAALMLSAGLAAMHYTGMAGLRVPALLQWDWHLVAASVLLPVALLLPALGIALRAKRHRHIFAATALTSLAVLVLHFTGTAALSFIPSRVLAEHRFSIPQETLAAWLCVVSLVIVAINVLIHRARQRAHSARLLGERQVSMLLKGSSDHAICMLDRSGRVAQWNAGGLSLIGYEEEEAIGCPLACFFTAEDRAGGRPERAIAEADANGIAKGEWICVRRDGSHFWAHGTIEKVCDEEGSVIGYSLITRDITRIKEAQDALAEKSGQLDTALEHMSQGLCMFDAQERLVLANRAFYRIWNIPQERCQPGTTLTQLAYAGFFSADYRPAQTLEMIRKSIARAHASDGNPSWHLDVSDELVLAISERPVPGGGWIVTFEDITRQRRSEAKIAHMAMHDALTGLPNRARFHARLDEMIAQAARAGEKVAVIAIDLDRFKEINDTFGHAAGDRLLRALAERFSATRRENEAIARLGGDEFAAALRFSRRSELNDFIARIQNCIGTPVADEGQPLGVGASLGIALFPQHSTARETLLNNADLAMYRAKATLGETVCFFETGMDESARERRQLASDLRQAAARGELSLLYQPQRSLHTGELAGYEALLRWTHPRRGLVSPAEFIPIAEETGEMIPLGEWVLRQACTEARTWPGGEKVAVNLSAIQFLQPDLVGMVRAILLETGLPARRLELEITETAIIHDKLRALHCLRGIKAMGVSVAIDDFGTGYSSLDTLQSFPFDKIKIDKSFLLKSEGSAQARAIIRAVLALGRSLEIPVLAEGIETEGQLRVLEAEGCDEGQGYYFGRPARAPSLESGQASGG
ncbi:EAL domain-containing protein [Novosphingobium sp. FGD1]|uniref:EAL domain-containing protein n=1 Tax=Novosphingobium silvae TaxID=2692619 RepID=A0A7X4K945_9SPHN|nr:EAL domain-containing protein [Novosphingobium silvae]MYL98993.1 EAL domain-containing protein [Novosphingobium silvae]